MKKIAEISAAIVSVFMIFSCMNSVSESGGASLIVNLPDTRSLVNEDDTVSDYSGGKYKITLSGKNIIERDAVAGASVEFDNLSSGDYTVSAAYYYEDECVAYGTEQTYVQNGRQSEVSLVVTLNKNSRINAIKEKDGVLYGVLSNGYEYGMNYTELITVTSDSVTIEGSGFDGVFIEDRSVTLSAYAIGKYEVTQEFFNAVMKENPSSFSTSPYNDDTQEFRPADSVSWYAAVAFCNKLSVMAGLDPCYSVDGVTDWTDFAYSDIPTESSSTWNAAAVDLTKNGYRLPTEAEWEFAARGGDTSADAWSYKYSGGTSIGTVSWWSSNSDKKTHEVGTKTENTLGIYDMIGNVRGWCCDWYAVVSAETVSNPVSSGGTKKVYRGGSWYDIAANCGVTGRNSEEPEITDNNSCFGLRLARSL